MGVIEVDNAKKYAAGSGVALLTRIPLHNTRQKRSYRIYRIGVFEVHNARKYAVGFGVALQAPIPLHTTSQKRCFKRPRMGVIEVDNAKKYAVGSRVALLTPIPLDTSSQKRCFWIPRMGVFEVHNAKICQNMVWLLGWRSKHPYHCAPQARKCIFAYLGWVALSAQCQKIRCGFWGGVPNTHNPAHHKPEKVFLDT